MSIRVEVRRGSYYDSVRLMQVTRDLLAMAGVDEALVAMATELNLGMLAEMGLAPDPAPQAGPDDLLIAVKATDAATLSAAWATVDASLAGRPPARSGGLFAPPPLHTAAGAGAAVAANMALISVPGPYAFVEAIDALRAGMHVMVFSDNVSIDHEVELKRQASSRGLLVMGPDCGTAIVGGVGLGFANTVDPGPVGITGASGTGIQQLCALFDASGVGVRHALGTGSRDLSSAVGGASTLKALEALDFDPAIEVIVIVSKPPDPAVRARVESAASRCSTPVVAALLGESGVTLEATADSAMAVLGVVPRRPPEWRPSAAPAARPGALRGLFSGGTLRDEATSIVAASLGPVATEIESAGHRLVDFGGDEFTRGRAHPMIDPTVRVQHLEAAIDDPETSVVLLDVVLGHGAHPDPAGDLAPIVAASPVPVVVSLCGTRRDPQDRDRQAERLLEAGAAVFVSSAAAARHAAALVREAPT